MSRRTLVVIAVTHRGFSTVPHRSTTDGGLVAAGVLREFAAL